MEYTPRTLKINPHSSSKSMIGDEQVTLKTKDDSLNFSVSPSANKDQRLFIEIEDLNTTHRKVDSKMFRYEFNELHSPKQAVTNQRLTEVEKSERIAAYNEERLDYSLKVMHPSQKQCDASDSLSINAPPSTYKEGHVYHVPSAIKKSILLGVVCYADVRIDKENRSGCVGYELKSLGAVVRKTFTEKVMVVVFHQGYKSTYFRAKELGVPLVSTSWIEACKAARAQVGTSMFPPHNMRKYEEILPYRAISSPRFRLPKKLKESNDIEGIKSFLEEKEKKTRIHERNTKIFRALINEML